MCGAGRGDAECVIVKPQHIAGPLDCCRLITNGSQSVTGNQPLSIDRTTVSEAPNAVDAQVATVG